MENLQKPIGFLLVNKPEGLTSFDCIRKLQRIFGKENKIGHSGTLDPFATGLLIIAIGRQATKHIDQIMQLDKEYIATGKLGVLTDTFDPEGKEIEQCAVPPLNEQDFIGAFAKLGKSYEQTPPIYSALKHEGMPLYDIARKGKESSEKLAEIIERKKRVVKIHELELLEFNAPFFKIRAHVSHGTYIRSLVNDIARLLGSCATTIALERTQIGSFNTSEAITLPEKEVGTGLEELLIPVEKFLQRLQR